jgi:hypothetical protein
LGGQEFFSGELASLCVHTASTGFSLSRETSNGMAMNQGLDCLHDARVINDPDETGTGQLG